jgi:hypothetical protein
MISSIKYKYCSWCTHASREVSAPVSVHGLIMKMSGNIPVSVGPCVAEFALQLAFNIRTYYRTVKFAQSRVT